MHVLDAADLPVRAGATAVRASAEAITNVARGTGADAAADDGHVLAPGAALSYSLNADAALAVDMDESTEIDTL